MYIPDIPAPTSPIGTLPSAASRFPPAPAPPGSAAIPSMEGSQRWNSPSTPFPALLSSCSHGKGMDSTLCTPFAAPSTSGPHHHGDGAGGGWILIHVGIPEDEGWEYWVWWHWWVCPCFVLHHPWPMELGTLSPLSLDVPDGVTGPGGHTHCAYPIPTGIKLIPAPLRAQRDAGGGDSTGC